MYRLQMLTPEEIIFDGEAISLIAPGSIGHLGVLSNHAPLITALKPGVFEFIDKNRKTHFYQISKGFLEIDHNQVFLLVDTIRLTGSVDMGTAIFSPAHYSK